ncbi:hypothetical protein CDL12_17264 [Handroanthus impetiginosus]|uniref:Uncharacterized protein n=1 Tax=Handroanthus impetiginosus TaxID=429701 RepID=A0A2G9GXY5_9LAMI|nr:hypothetical protein CDL12_17264 [Handroanthus impetiginosus]
MISGDCGKPKLPQVLFQVFSRWMLSISFKLCSPRRHLILQTPFFTALQRKRELQPFNQVCIDETCNCCCSRFLSSLAPFDPRLLLSIYNMLVCVGCVLFPALYA